MKCSFHPTFRVPLILGCSQLLISCASFQNQTGELEPHGRVTVAKREDFRNERGASPGISGKTPREVAEMSNQWAAAKLLRELERADR